MVSFSKDVNPDDIKKLTPKMRLLLEFVIYWSQARNIELHITSLIRSTEQNNAVKSKSTTHMEGRAVDFSIKEKYGWTYDKLQKLVNELNNLVECRTLGIFRNVFYNIGAISAHDNQQRSIVIHKNYNNNLSHAHLQVRR